MLSPLCYAFYTVDIEDGVTILPTFDIKTIDFIAMKLTSVRDYLNAIWSKIAGW